MQQLHHLFADGFAATGGGDGGSHVAVLAAGGAIGESTATAAANSICPTSSPRPYLQLSRHQEQRHSHAT